MRPRTAHSRLLVAAACAGLLAPSPTRAEPPLPDRAAPPVADRSAGAGGPPSVGGGSSGARPAVLGAEQGGLDFSGILSLDIATSDYRVGPRISAEMMYGALDISPQLRLLTGVRGSFAYHGRSAGGSLWILEGVPDVKVRFGASEQLALFADFGLGLAFRHTSVDLPGAPGASQTDDAVNLALQFGLGAALALTPDLSLFTEFRVNCYTKDKNPVFIAFPSLGLTWKY